MRNVSDKSWRENPNTHFMFNKLSPKIVPVMRKRLKAVLRILNVCLVALVIQLDMRMRLVICGLYGFTVFFRVFS